jgi:excisionase family DNA binding protein
LETNFDVIAGREQSIDGGSPSMTLPDGHTFSVCFSSFLTGLYVSVINNCDNWDSMARSYMSKKVVKYEEILNADEVSEWLKIPKSTLYKLCTEGDVPAAKIGRHWRFSRPTIEKWFAEKSQPKPNSKKPHDS